MTYVWRLVVLDEAAERTLGRSEGAVQHVDVHLACLILRLQATAYLEPSALYIDPEQRHEQELSGNVR